jgi:hypothetical protein
VFWKILNRIFAPERKPEIVRWSPVARGHQSDESGKQIIHRDVILDLSSPHFNSNETWVYIVVSNTGRKSLGFGSTGIGLALTSGPRTIAHVCKALKLIGRVSDEDEYHQSILVAPQTHHSTFVAVFDPAPQPERAEMVIQVNRILASPYVFIVPFEMETKTVEQPVGTFEELLELDATTVRSIQVRPRETP